MTLRCDYGFEFGTCRCQLRSITVLWTDRQRNWHGRSDAHGDRHWQTDRQTAMSLHRSAPDLITAVPVSREDHHQRFAVTNPIYHNQRRTPSGTFAQLQTAYTLQTNRLTNFECSATAINRYVRPQQNYLKPSAPITRRPSERKLAQKPTITYNYLCRW